LVLGIIILLVSYMKLWGKIKDLLPNKVKEFKWRKNKVEPMIEKFDVDNGGGCCGGSESVSLLW
jgi:hypothetical protein